MTDTTKVADEFPALAPILREARALVSAGWTQGAMRRKVRNRICYCAAGAVFS